MHKTKMEIIARLWRHITDLLMMAEGKSPKGLEEVKDEIDLTEYYCRPYADCDDDELYAGYIKKSIEKERLRLD